MNYKALLLPVFLVGIALCYCSIEGMVLWDGQEGWYASVSYLRWKAQEHGLQYASKLPEGIPSINDSPAFFPANVREQDFSFDSGVRVVAGAVVCEDWNVRARITRFTTQSGSNVSSNVLDTGLVESAFGNLLINPIIFGRTARACWNLNFLTADFDCGRFINLCDCDTVIVEPFIGITAARIKQNQKVNGGIVPINSDLSFNTMIATRCCKFSGVGPRIGCDGAWNFAPHWSLVGSASGALVIGTVRASAVNVMSDRIGIAVPICCTRDHQNWTNPFEPGWRFLLDDPTFTAKFCNKKTRLRPGVALTAGLEWDNNFNDCFSAFASVLFEAQYWPDQWQCPQSPLGWQVGMIPGGGDLSLYGVTISWGLFF